MMKGQRKILVYKPGEFVFLPGPTRVIEKRRTVGPWVASPHDSPLSRQG